jgi:hypothetical protein
MNIITNKVNYYYPFLYDTEKVNSEKNIKIKKVRNLEFFNHIENYLNMNNTNSNEPPFGISVKENAFKGIIVERDSEKENLYVEDIKIYFFRENLAILSIEVGFQRTMIERIPKIISNLAWLDRKNIKLTKKISPFGFVQEIEGKIDGFEEFRNEYMTIVFHEKNNKTYVKGFDLKLNSENKKINEALKVNYSNYKDSMTKTNLNDFISTYINKYSLRDNLNPFSLKKLKTYIVKYEDQIDYSFINSLLLLTNYNKQEQKLTLSNKQYDLTETISIYANELCTIVCGKNENTDYMNKSFIENYLTKYYYVNLIVNFQRFKLLNLIYKSTILDIEALKNDSADENKLYKITELKDNIIYFITRLDYSNISNNPVINTFYKVSREQLDIKNLLSEIDNVINKLDSEKEKIVEYQEEKREKQKEKWITRLGIAIAVISVPWFELYDRISSFFK